MTKLNEDDLKKVTGAGSIKGVEPDPVVGEYKRPVGGGAEDPSDSNPSGGGGTPIDEDPPIQEL